MSTACSTTIRAGGSRRCRCARAATVEALRRQKGRYTLAILDAEPRIPDDRGASQALRPRRRAATCARLLADPAVRMVTTP